MISRPSAWLLRQVPGNNEWSGYEQDLDVACARKLFFGKRADEILKYYEGGHAIQRMDELLFMPRGAFQYYVFSFAEYLFSEQARGDSDAASPFLTLLTAREERDPGSVAEIYDDLRGAVDFVADNQEYFDADEEIYGNFPDRRDQIEAQVKAFSLADKKRDNHRDA